MNRPKTAYRQRLSNTGQCSSGSVSLQVVRRQKNSITLRIPEFVSVKNNNNAFIRHFIFPVMLSKVLGLCWPYLVMSLS